MFGRAFSGESMFVNRYTARNGNGLIAFASSFPGSIRAFEIAPGQEIIAQKSAFLASSASVEMSIFFQKRFGSGLFGGDTQGQGTDLTIGSGSYIDDFEDQLIGAHPGDKVEVKVPQLVGLTSKEAKDKLSSLGLKYAESKEVSDKLKDTVLRSNPEAGATLEQGDTVTVVLSDGQ